VNRAALHHGAQELGLDLSDEALHQLEQFEEALYVVNQQTNLTRVPREECWQRHFLDSLLVSSLIPIGVHVLDIGTGPGFPAWPLALARPDLTVVAADSAHKMTDFLRQFPLPNLIVAAVRIEEQRWSQEFDLITGRAFAPLAVMLEVASRACRVGGAIVPFRTPIEQPLAQAFPAEKLGLYLESNVLVRLSGTDVVRYFPTFRKQTRTPQPYPRPWAKIKKNPISA